MSADQTYANAKKVFEELEIGEKTSALELANRIGATVYEERKKIAAFLSQQAKRGRAKKHLGEDGRMYYEKAAPSEKPPTRRVARSKETFKDKTVLEDVAEKIADHIQRLRTRVEELEKETAALKQKLTVFSKQREEFKRLYEGMEQKLKGISEKQPAAQETIPLPEATEE